MTRILSKLFGWWNTGKPKEVDIIKPKVQTLYTYESENPKKQVFSRPKSPEHITNTVQTESNIQTLSNVSTATDPIQYDLEKFNSERVKAEAQEQNRDNPFDIRFYKPPNMKTEMPKKKYGFQETCKQPQIEQNAAQTTSTVSLGGLKFIFGRKKDATSQKSDDESSKSTSDDDDRIEEDDKGHISDNSFYFYSDDKMENDFSFGGHFMVEDTPKYHQNQIPILAPQTTIMPEKQENESSYTYETESEYETQDRSNLSTSADESDTSHHHIETNYNQISSSDELVVQQQPQYQPVYSFVNTVNPAPSEEEYSEEEEEERYTSSEQDIASTISPTVSTAADSTSSESTESDSYEEDSKEEEEAESTEEETQPQKRPIVTKTIPPKNAGMKIPRQSMYNPVPLKQSDSDEESSSGEEEEEEEDDESNKSKTTTEEEKEENNEEEDDSNNEEKHSSSSSQMVSDDVAFPVERNIMEPNADNQNDDDISDDRLEENSEENGQNDDDQRENEDQNSENDDQNDDQNSENDEKKNDQNQEIEDSKNEEEEEHSDNDQVSAQSPKEVEEDAEDLDDVQNLISYESLKKSVEAENANELNEKPESMQEQENKFSEEENPEEYVSTQIQNIEIPTKPKPVSTIQLRPPEEDEIDKDEVSQSTQNGVYSFGQDDTHFGDEDMDNINYEVGHEYSDFHEL